MSKHHRFSVIGTSGSGKTTLGRALAARLAIPFVELDSIIHQANWVALPDAEFRARVAALADVERWVIDGNYHVVRDLVWDRATTIVWLDLPRWQIMAQVIWRSVSRAAMRKELWNGNRERWSALVGPSDPLGVAHLSRATAALRGIARRALGAAALAPRHAPLAG